jgi:hypothetical protein
LKTLLTLCYFVMILSLGGSTIFLTGKRVTLFYTFLLRGRNISKY